MGEVKAARVLLVAAALFSLALALSAEDGAPASGDNLLLADIPIVYGEESFVRRIAERTGGEREPVGLILSGGSARAFAHIGVLRYMEEHDIVPDFVIGNSMGSIIALLYCAGMSPDQILMAMDNIDLTELFNLRLPLNSGLLDTSMFKSYIKALFPKGKSLEDLDIPIMIVCEDLATKRQVWIAEGDCLDAMMASFAIPIYFNSVRLNDHVLIDGGFANIAPVEIGFKYAPFNIISTTFYNNTDINLSNPLTALNVSIDIGKTRQGMKNIQSHPDDSLWVRCDVEGFSYMEFSAADEIAQRGYESAKAAFESPANAAKLKGIRYGAPVPDSSPVRRGFGALLEKFNQRHQYHNHISAAAFNQGLTLGAKSFSYVDDPYVLRNDTLIGIQYGMRYGDWNMGLTAGFSWQASSFGLAVPAANLCNQLFILDALKLETNLSFFIDTSRSPSTPSPVCYLSQEALYSFPAVGPWRFRILGFYQMVNNYSADIVEMTTWNGLAHLFTAGGVLDFAGADVNANLQFGSEMSLWGETFRPFGYARLNTSNSIRTGRLKTSLRVAGRFALDGKGNVPFFAADGFRTKAQSVLLQGGPPGRRSVNPCNFTLESTIALGFDLSPDKPLTIGELLLFRDSIVQLYCDLLWRGLEDEPAVPDIGAGVEIKTRISLIGLHDLSISLYLGYDGPGKGVIGGLRLGRSE